MKNLRLTSEPSSADARLVRTGIGPADASQVGIPLAQAPTGARVRLITPNPEADPSATLRAMGFTADETLIVHQAGEPTIVSLGGWDGRRIGLSRKIACDLLVVIEQ